MMRIEMLDNDKRHSGFWGQHPQQLHGGFKAAGGPANADDRTSGVLSRAPINADESLRLSLPPRENDALLFAFDFAGIAIFILGRRFTRTSRDSTADVEISYNSGFRRSRFI